MLGVFITSIKLTKQKLVTAIIVVGVLLVALIIWLASQGGTESQATAAELPSVKNMKTEQDRVGFLTACGWQVSADSAESQEVLIPKTFDDVFDNYNELQKTQGFDLSQYKNKRVMRYTYTVTNYPTGEAGVQATLLVYNNKIVGGDICSAKLDGFMHGFQLPKT